MESQPYRASLWSALRRTPACTAILAAGFAGLAACEARQNVDHLLLLPGRELGEPWRFVTTLMPHFTPVQFAVYAVIVWAYGRRIEAALGVWRFASLALWAAGVGGGLEAAAFHGPIGLSGVAFSCVAFVHVRAATEPSFRDLATAQNLQLVAAWAAASVLFGAVGFLPVSHGAQLGGALVGVALGRCWNWVPVGLFALNLGLIVFLQPWLAALRADDWVLTQLAHAAHRTGDYGRAVERYEAAIAAGDDSLLSLLRLSESLEGVGRREEARAALEEIASRDPSFVERVTGQGRMPR